MTITNQCGGAAISGASVTVTDSHGATVGTCSTNGSGQCCVGVTKKDTYTITVTKTGFYDRTTTNTFTVCDVTHNVSLTLYPTTGTITFTGQLCCGTNVISDCCPSVTEPITFSVTQTAGGSFTGTCDQTNCSGCTITGVPLPQPTDTPGTGCDYTFDWTASAPSMASQTGTITFRCYRPNWTCSKAPSLITLTTPDDDFCFVPTGCYTSPPASVTVSFSGPACDSCAGGPITLNFVSADKSGCVWTYGATIACGGAGFNTYTFTIRNSFFSCDPIASMTSSTTCICTYGISTCLLTVPGGGWSVSGTVACPIALTWDDGAGSTITVTE